MEKRVSGRTFIIGAAVAAIGLVTESAITWVSKETPPVWAPVTTAFVTIVVAGINAVVEKSKDTEPPPLPMDPSVAPNYAQTLNAGAYPQRVQSGYPGQPGYRHSGHPVRYTSVPRARSRRGFSIVAVMLVVLLLCGGGAFLASTYVPKLIVSMSQAPWQRSLGHGTQRLTEPARSQVAGLTVTVTGVEVYQDETVLDITVKNDNDGAVTIPLYDEAALNVPGSATLQPDDARSDSTWPDTIAGNATSSGSVAFTGTIPADTTTATLTFATVYLPGPTPPPSVSVPLKLTH